MSYDQAGIGFTVESPVATAEELEKYILSLNETFAQFLAALSEKAFSETKSILKAVLLPAPESVAVAIKLCWADILTTSETASSHRTLTKLVGEVEMTTVLTVTVLYIRAFIAAFGEDPIGHDDHCYDTHTIMRHLSFWSFYRYVTHSN